MTVRPYIAVSLLVLALTAGCRKNESVPDSAAAPASPAEEASSLPDPQPVSAEAGGTIAGLGTSGAKFVFEKDGRLKSADFSEMNGPASFDEAENARWKSLRVLRGKGPVSDSLAQQITQCPNLTEFLWVETGLSPAGFDALSHAQKIKKLRLAGLEADPDSLLCLQGMPELSELDLSGASLSDACMEVLSDLPALTRLNLYRNKVGDRGVEFLTPLAGKLVWLNLDDTRITDAAGPNLCRFQNLKFLHLGRTEITDAVIDSLSQLKNLDTIHITRTGITEEGAARLRAALPDTEVISAVQAQ